MIEELLLALGIDTTRFRVGLKKSESLFATSMKRMRSNAEKTLGAGLSIAAITRMTRGALDAADRIDNLRQQLNATTDEIQHLDIAFNDAGLGGVERLAEGLESLNRNRQAAVEGNVQMRDSFDTLGISIEEVNNASIRSIEILKKLANQRGINSDIRLRNAATRLISQEAGKFLGAVRDSDSESVKSVPILTESEIKALDDAQLSLARGINSATTTFNKIAALFVKFTDNIDYSLFGPIGGSLTKQNKSIFSNIEKTILGPVGGSLWKKYKSFIEGSKNTKNASHDTAPSGSLFDTAEQTEFNKRVARLNGNSLPSLRAKMAELAKNREMISIRQSGISTRSIGGLAFSARPDQIITIQNKQLTELQEQTKAILQMHSEIRKFSKPF